MALDVLGLVFATKSNRTKIQGELEIPIDAAVTVTHNYGHTITSVPIEDGSAVDEHAVRNPDAVTIDGFVTDHPVRSSFAGIAGSIAGGLVGSLGGSAAGAVGATIGSTIAGAGAVGGVLGDVLGSERPSISAYALLLKAFDEKKLLDIVTRYHTFESMMIESLEIPQSRDVGEALRFTMTLRKIAKVKTAQSEVTGRILDSQLDVAA